MRYTKLANMDFLDPKKKKAHKIRLYVGYFLMAIALSIGTLILLFEAFGYDVNRKTGEIIQNGLVFVDAHPEQARVIMNGKQEGQTDMRLTLPTGAYSFELQRDGYRTWKRSFELEGSIIERMTYPFLFPEKLEPKDVQLYASAPQFATQSPDRRWLLVLKPGGLNGYDMTDLNDKNNPITPLTLPNNLFTAAAGEHSLETVEWSNNNRHLLVKHVYRGGFEFVMIDREDPTQSFQVNKTFGIPITQVAMRDKKFDQLHLLDANGGILRFGEVKSKGLTLLANQVKSFKSYGSDVVLYVTEEGAPEGKALVQIRQGDKTYKIRELPKSQLYVTDVTRYDDRWYMAVGTDAEKKTYVYEQVFDDVARQKPRVPAPVAVLKLQQLQYLSVSANTRFIGVQGGSEFAVYDAEHSRQYRYDTKLALAPGQKATWMDGHRLAVISEKQVAVFDFDGINLQKLSASEPGFLPFFDRDYDNLYTIGTSAAVKDKTALIRTSVRIPSDE